MIGRLATLTIALLAAIAVIRAAAVRDPVAPHRPLAGLPLTLGDWRWRRDLPLDAGTVSVLKADDYISRSYVRGGSAADLFIGYYATQEEGGAMHSPMNCLPAAGWQPMSIGRVRLTAAGAAPIEANRYVIQQGLDKRLVLFWYQSHGRTVASDYASRAYLVLDALRLHRSDAAIVRVITPLTSRDGDADRAAADFVRVMRPALAGYLPV
jgi:EpsI family protein